MSGGGTQNSSSGNPYIAAANASANGAAGTAGNVADTANMPQWQKGLLGAMTGSTAFGQSSPATHQLLAAGMQMMQSGQGQTGQARPMQRPNVPAGGAMPYPGAQAPAPQASPMGGAPPPGAMPQGGAPGQSPQQNPWLLGLQGH